MVTSSPDLKGMRLDNFTKSARELRKLTDDLQDVSIGAVVLHAVDQHKGPQVLHSAALVKVDVDAEKVVGVGGADAGLGGLPGGTPLSVYRPHRC